MTDTYGYVGDSETVAAIVGATTRVSALSADGSRVATREGSTTGFLIPDLHGNVAAAEQSGSATIAVALRYDGYGQTLGSPYTGTGAIALDARYQGRLDLSATSDPLYDMAARFYSPGTGTFTQLDSVLGSAQNPLSMNRFLYAEANPATFIDPTGHFVSEGDSTQTSRCHSSGDWGCGRTAAASKSKVRAAALRPRSRTTYHGKGRGSTWRDQGPSGPAKPTGEPISENEASSGDWGFDLFGPVKWSAGFGVGLVGSAANVVGNTAHGVTHLDETAAGIGYAGSSVIGSVTSGQAGHDLVAGWNYWWTHKSAATHTGDAFQDGLGASTVASDIFSVGAVAYGGVGIAKAGIGALQIAGPTGEAANPIVSAARAMRNLRAAAEGPKISTVTAGWGRAEKIVTGCAGRGYCAEDDVVRQLVELGEDPADVRFTEALRPRTQEQVPICTRCQEKYDPSQFPPDTIYTPGGRWDNLR